MNTNATAPQATPTDWADFVLTQPSLPMELRAEFFVSAPQGTLVEVDGDLFQFNFAGLWVALGEVVLEGNFGSPYATHESYEPRFLVGLANSTAVAVRVLRLGEPLSYAASEAKSVADHLNAVNQRLAQERAQGNS